MAQALYRKWRPQTWGEVVGQEHVIRTLRNAVRGDRIAHAYLFAGPRGTGKTTTARLLAKAANCLAEELADRPCNRCEPCREVVEGRFLDLVEIDAASNTSVDDVRDLRDRINFSPNKGRYKVYIVDEVHMLSISAFNALLKTLEEPPDHAIFILATTEVHKIPATVLSRCQRHEFRRIPTATIRAYLDDQVERENIQVEQGVMRLIARQSTGSLRDAISLLDQLAATEDEITYALTQRVLGTVTHTQVQDLVRAIAARDQATGLALIHQALNGGADPRQLARQIVDHLRELLFLLMGAEELVEAGGGEREQMRAVAGEFKLQDLLGAMEAFGQASFDSRSSWLPSLGLEMALIESTLEGDDHEGEDGSARTGGRPGGGAEPRARTEGGGAPSSTPKGDMPSSGEAPARGRGKGTVESASPPKSPGARQIDSQARSRPETDAEHEEVSFHRVKDRWPDVLGAVYIRDPLAQALLRSGKPLGLAKGTLVIGFPSELLKEKMEKGQNLRVLKESLAEALGGGMEVRCVIRDRWDQGEAQADPPPVEDGGMVATAMRDFGAQVVDVGPATSESEGEDEES
jgi:DNA polymerase-3 subunit gamma/tau